MMIDIYTAIVKINKIDNLYTFKNITIKTYSNMVNIQIIIMHNTSLNIYFIQILNTFQSILQQFFKVESIKSLAYGIQLAIYQIYAQNYIMTNKITKIAFSNFSAENKVHIRAPKNTKLVFLLSLLVMDSNCLLNPMRKPELN